MFLLMLTYILPSPTIIDYLSVQIYELSRHFTKPLRPTHDAFF